MSTRNPKGNKELDVLDEMIEEITVDTYGDDEMLWLNPSDNQGVRFLIDEVNAKTAWEDRENE